MSVKIVAVEKGGIAEKLGIRAGDFLISINGNKITDVLDYRFFETEPKLLMEYCRDGRVLEISVVKSRYSSIGLEFESFLMDEERSCKNKCIFCFIDQMPKGMRRTLYFKDDDERLSFLFGNYITLTNITDREIDRIIQMRISPINISVHTMNPDLRIKMMKNSRAGETLKYIYKLSENGISINCQIVLCPDVNDGDNLRFSLEQMLSLGESLNSVACVPAGLTRYRKGLYPLRSYTQQEAKSVLDMINNFGEVFLKERGRRTIYASDELYLIAGVDIPEAGFYDDFPQIENGVGMLACFREEVELAVSEMKHEMKHIEKTRKITIATGEGAAAFIDKILDVLRVKCNNLLVKVIPIRNDFFGTAVNVAGLVTGGDLIKQLRDIEIGDALLIPSVMLKSDEDIFLDDVTLDDVRRELRSEVVKVYGGGYLVSAILGEEFDFEPAVGYER